ncbi:MAG: helix-turn-helix transcriptional regulator [Methanobacteriota archaeon]|nr:MAG: helix-turn-helix transcriptional regulator [Euryarchaeota archaeon]
MTKPRNQKGTERPIAPLLAYQADPIRESVKRLGRKWTLLILRDMAFLEVDRFGKILRNNPGLTARVLSRRLRQMQSEGLVERLADGDSVRYRLTDRGEDAVFILLAFLRYGIKHRLTAAPSVRSRLP